MYRLDKLNTSNKSASNRFSFGFRVCNSYVYLTVFFIAKLTRNLRENVLTP